MPQDIMSLMEQFVYGKKIATAVVSVVIIVAIIVGMVALVVLLNGGVRKIPVQYAKKVQGRKMVGGQTATIPLKINTAGVIPIIFAQSIMQFPIIVCTLVGYNGTGIWSNVLRFLNSGNWCKPSEPVYSIGLVIYIVLVIFFLKYRLERDFFISPTICFSLKIKKFLIYLRSLYSYS